MYWKPRLGAPAIANRSSPQVKEDYVESLEALPLPVAEVALDARHERALTAALAAFDKDSFGVAGSPDLDVRSPCHTVPAPCAEAKCDLTCVLQLFAGLMVMSCLSAMLGQGVWRHQCHDMMVSQVWRLPRWSSPAQILRDALVLGCGREYEARKTANMLASTQACEAAEEECEAVLEREQSGTLPSTGEPPLTGLLPGSKSV